MKKKIIVLLTALAAFFITSCTNPGLIPGDGTDTGTNDTGTVRFSWSDGEQASRSRANNILDADKVVITIEAADGTVVYNQKQLNLFNFNGSFISEPLSLKVGNYKLTEYLILDSAGTVIFATPKAGSAQAHLVTMPLPHDFTVTKDGTTKVKPQVVDAAAVNPADFGYIGFNFEEAKIFNFMVSVMIYDASADGFILTDAALDVTTDAKAYSFALTGTTNSLAINDVAGNYTLTLKKAGYEEYRATFTNAEMKGFFENPLVITPVEIKVITFADANLEAIVRQRVIKPTGAITSTDVAALTHLQIVSLDISNLSGIEQLTSLKVLALGGEKITDFTPLSSLTGLNRLLLSKMRVSDLSFIKPLRNMKELIIDTNTTGVVDYTPLASLASLELLYLNSCSISDMSTIPLMPNLTKLSLTDNKITDLSTLKVMPKLLTLNLRNNSISNLSPLSAFTSLKNLILQNTGISDLTPISNLTGLTNLYLADNQITDITALSGMINLNYLELTNNSVTDISPVQQMTKIVVFYLRNNRISDLTPMVNNSGLNNSSIYLEGNPLSAAAKSTQIPALEARGSYVTF